MNSNFQVFLIVLLTTSLSFAANKKVLVISDVDDTLKVSHILNPVRAAARVPNYSAHFTGMAQLFQLLQRQPGTDTKFVYLSNAPAHVAGFATLLNAHKRFLAHNKFPAGELNLRVGLFERDHKIVEIRKLVKSQNPDAIIFLGDNGERDVEIYNQARLEFRSRNIQIMTFIHQVYKTKRDHFDNLLFPEVGIKPLAEQVGYVTPVEIALELQQQGLLDTESLTWVTEQLAPFIAAEKYYDSDTFGAIMFPSFQRCRDFVWRWPVTNALVPLVQKVKSVCR